MKYRKSVINYFSLHHPLGQLSKICKFLNLFNNRNQDVKPRAQKEYNIDISRDDWIYERSSVDSVPLIREMNECGGENHFKDLQKSIQEELFWKN